MKKIYSKPLYRLVDAGIREKFPFFKKDKKIDFGQLYSWRIPGVTNVFLAFLIDPKEHQRFFAKFAWTRSNEYTSIDEFSYRFPADPTAALDDSEVIAGVQRLWGEQGVGAWEVPDPMSTFRAIDHAGRDGKDIKAALKEMERRMNEEKKMTETDGEKFVAPLVDDLLDKLEKYAIPYLRMYVERATAAKAG